MTNKIEIAKAAAFYKLHDEIGTQKPDTGMCRPLTNAGASILDDIEFHLESMGEVAESYYVEAIAVFAEKLLGEHLAKAND
ncbi:MAG: hypothetical protein COA43_01135 [Robiginitomaculum sp.]|nr:MAG: hypothetical protein COA43_01135 [Robiginitomaculum sp.]